MSGQKKTLWLSALGADVCHILSLTVTRSVQLSQISYIWCGTCIILTLTHFISHLRYYESRGGGLLHQFFGNRVQHVITNWTQSNLRLCKKKMKDQKDLRSMKKESIGLKIMEKKTVN